MCATLETSLTNDLTSNTGSPNYSAIRNVIIAWGWFAGWREVWESRKKLSVTFKWHIITKKGWKSQHHGSEWRLDLKSFHSVSSWQMSRFLFSQSWENKVWVCTFPISSICVFTLFIVGSNKTTDKYVTFWSGERCCWLRLLQSCVALCHLLMTHQNSIPGLYSDHEFDTQTGLRILFIDKWGWLTSAGCFQRRSLHNQELCDHTSSVWVFVQH